VKTLAFFETAQHKIIIAAFFSDEVGSCVCVYIARALLFRALRARI
jgi:hypothetical protein